MTHVEKTIILKYLMSKFKKELGPIHLDFSYDEDHHEYQNSIDWIQGYISEFNNLIDLDELDQLTEKQKVIGQYLIDKAMTLFSDIDDCTQEDEWANNRNSEVCNILAEFNSIIKLGNSKFGGRP